MVGRPVDAQVLAVAGRRPAACAASTAGAASVSDHSSAPGLAPRTATATATRPSVLAARLVAVERSASPGRCQTPPRAEAGDRATPSAFRWNTDGARRGQAGDLAGHQHRAVGQRQHVVGLDGDAGRRELHLALHAPAQVGAAVGQEARDDRLRLVAGQAGAHHPGAARGVDAHAGRRVVVGAQRERGLAVAAEALVGRRCR